MIFIVWGKTELSADYECQTVSLRCNSVLQSMIIYALMGKINYLEKGKGALSFEEQKAKAL